MAALTDEERKIIEMSDSVDGCVARKLLKIYDDNPHTILKKDVKAELKKFIEKEKNYESND